MHLKHFAGIVVFRLLDHFRAVVADLSLYWNAESIAAKSANREGAESGMRGLYFRLVVTIDSKIELGHTQDMLDVAAMLEYDLIDRTGLLELFLR